MTTPYPRTFFPQLAPPVLDHIARVNGVAPAARPGLRWCELGCGRGLTPLFLAAAWPEASFVAVDPDATSIAEGQDLARRAGLTNLDLRACGVEDLSDEAPFDFVVMHGLYVWVDDGVRRAIRDFLARSLRPGGLVFISYDTLPGWSAVWPIMRLIRAGADGARWPAVREGLARFDALRRAGADYFSQHPVAAERLDQWRHSAAADPAYLTSEILDLADLPLGREVAAALAPSGLDFCGRYPLALNHLDLVVPRESLAVLLDLGSRAAIEDHVDLIRGESLRQDVFVHSGQDLDASGIATHRAKAAFGRAPRLDGGGPRSLGLDDPLFVGLYQDLADGPRTVADLAAARPEVPIAQVDEALQVLAAVQLILPFAGTDPRPAPALNRHLLARDLRPGRPALLASPVAGNALPVPFADALILNALWSGVADGDLLPWTSAWLADWDADPADHRGALDAARARWRQGRFGIYHRLGLIDGDLI